MGLAERRATKNFQDKSFPQLRAELTKVAGFEVPLEINWDQLAKEGVSDRYDENWRKVYFQPVIEALKTITADEMGKEALKASLKMISMCNTSGKYSASSAITFVGGELKIDHDPDCNVDYITERTDYTRELLEKGL
jgi:hypothetical protein